MTSSELAYSRATHLDQAIAMVSGRPAAGYLAGAAVYVVQYALFH